ncbi:CinA family protein [Roseovarius gahaiensis]|uniref:CinA family protein n=1 Tax=Roseovarius gahaiensis TaxID=2716691 RepID=A0A967BHP4_9RHOB|nr:CinA family protein [Roseovarius gahaiensis]NHQ75298.1 CinA family protein [Roseovarius gahaiensis]
MIKQEIIDLARSLNLRVATAESCTGGMVSVALTDMPGASDVMDRGFVTYSNAAKVEMLGVSTDSLMAHGAVSEQVAQEMAEGALSRSAADLTVAITGVAGPGGSEHKPEGRVCFGLARKGLKTFTDTQEFGAQGRDTVRQLSRDHALALLKRSLV